MTWAVNQTEVSCLNTVVGVMEHCVASPSCATTPMGRVPTSGINTCSAALACATLSDTTAKAANVYSTPTPCRTRKTSGWGLTRRPSRVCREQYTRKQTETDSSAAFAAAAVLVSASDVWGW